MSHDPRVSLHVPRYALIAFGVLLVAPWCLLAGWWLSNHSHPAESPTAPALIAPGTPHDLVQGNPGPWGRLEYFRIMLEPPEEFVPTDDTEIQMKPWFFRGYSEAQLMALWTAAGLTADEMTYVTNPAHRKEQPGAIAFTPDRDFIVGLSANARARIYLELAAFTENSAQSDPFRLRTVVASDWLDHTDIPENAIALTKQLFYQRGPVTCFSDAAIVLPSIPTAAQRVKYIKALARKSGLLVQLRIGPGENVDPLVEYWARGGRSKDLKPLLQSVARRSQGGTIDVVHLIPRFARQLAYTYPLPSEKPIDGNHDCHWTSLNFQNDAPDERFSNIEYVRQVLLDQYYPVVGPPLLGDVIMFVRADGAAVHSCVYVADDIVFTKNGAAFSVPWLLAPLADVQAFYASAPGTEMRRYRAKTL